MSIENVVTKIAAPGRARVLTSVTASALHHEWVRRLLMTYVDHRIDQRLDQASDPGEISPPGVVRDKAQIFQALIHSVNRGLASGSISESATKGILRGLTNAFAHSERRAAHDRFPQEHNGKGAPAFLVMSPGKLCNLRCKGCYASSQADKEKLDWEVFDRVITEAQELWGLGFMVISGGEPLAYRSHGKGILDAAEKHPDTLFLMYTNGTLIDKKTAARIAEVGNLTPAISVEGMEERTDARRGKGVFQRVLQAMANLREAGVPFGVSLTATCDNCEELLSDEFLDFFFEEQGALYGWLFQYMPIGRGFTLDLLPSPEQRVWMWQRTWQVIRERQVFLADFWNLGPCSNGCISAGRGGGYLYIDWNGKVMPCVFVPYSPVNINDAYQQGKTLNDILEEPFFKSIRDWQDGYGYTTKPKECKNWLMPCIIRDHHRDFRRILEETKPEPEDNAALEAMMDQTYRDGLIRYNEDVARLMDPIWEREYLAGNGKRLQRE